MKIQKTISIVIAIVLAALILVSLVFSFSGSGRDSALRKILHSCYLVTLSAALVYIALGATKASGIWFKIFKGCLALCYYLTLMRGIQAGRNVFGCALNALAFGLICMLITAKDLGKNKSLIIALLITALEAAFIVITSLHVFKITRLFSAVINVAFAMMLLTMTELKYIDKEERHSKI